MACRALVRLRSVSLGSRSTQTISPTLDTDGQHENALNDECGLFAWNVLALEQPVLELPVLELP